MFKNPGKLNYGPFVPQNFRVISREIRPLAALYPHTYKKCFIGLRSRALLSIYALSGRLRDLRPFLLYQSKKNIRGGGYYAARGLISRDIAKFSWVKLHSMRMLLMDIVQQL